MGLRAISLTFQGSQGDQRYTIPAAQRSALRISRLPTFPAASEVVDAPAHARVLIDVDGRFSDIPDSDWRGEDAFTDVLGDGSARCNVATAQGLTGRRGQHQQIDVPG